MISDPGLSQIDDKTYAPLVAVKNGLVTYITTDGLIDLNNVSALKLPKSRYDFVLRLTLFEANAEGIVSYTGQSGFLVKKGQTEIEFTRRTLAKIEAEIITTEI